MGRRALPVAVDEQCIVDGCTSRQRIKSLKLCQRHRAKQLNRPCSVDDCDRYMWSKNMCSTHNRRLATTGSLDAPAPPKRRYEDWSGMGYVMLYKPDHPSAPSTGLIAEHRVVMEEKLGRQLLPGENVHHINGIRDDNRPENLELWVVHQPSGQRPEDLVAWAKEILKRYG